MIPTCSTLSVQDTAGSTYPGLLMRAMIEAKIMEQGSPTMMNPPLTRNPATLHRARITMWSSRRSPATQSPRQSIVDHRAQAAQTVCQMNIKTLKGHRKSTIQSHSLRTWITHPSDRTWSSGSRTLLVTDAYRT